MWSVDYSQNICLPVEVSVENNWERSRQKKFIQPSPFITKKISSRPNEINTSQNSWHRTKGVVLSLSIYKGIHCLRCSKLLGYGGQSWRKLYQPAVWTGPSLAWFGVHMLPGNHHWHVSTEAPTHRLTTMLVISNPDPGDLTSANVNMASYNHNEVHAEQLLRNTTHFCASVQNYIQRAH